MPMEAGYSRCVPKSAGREDARENHPHESTHESQLFGKNEGMSLVIPPLMAKMGDGERQALIPKSPQFQRSKIQAYSCML